MYCYEPIDFTKKSREEMLRTLQRIQEICRMDVPEGYNKPVERDAYRFGAVTANVMEYKRE